MEDFFCFPPDSRLFSSFYYFSFIPHSYAFLSFSLLFFFLVFVFVFWAWPHSPGPLLTCLILVPPLPSLLTCSNNPDKLTCCSLLLASSFRLLPSFLSLYSSTKRFFFSFEGREKQKSCSVMSSIFFFSNSCVGSGSYEEPFKLFHRYTSLYSPVAPNGLFKADTS